VAATARLTVRVTPRADADRIGPFADGVLQARVTRPPADGEANHAVRLLVARALGVPRSSVVLLSGARSRTKRFAISGVSEAYLVARLSGIGD
jgi:hypothetical protein